MNEQQQLIKDTLDRMLTDLCTPEVVDKTEAGTFAKDLWNALAETGLTVAGLPEGSGGAGGELEDSLLVIRESARYAAPIPLAEHFVAGMMIAMQDGKVGHEILTVATGDFQVDASGKVTGSGEAPFGRWADRIVFVADASGTAKLCVMPTSDLSIEEAMSIAGEPRDIITVDVTPDGNAVMTTDDDSGDKLKLMMAAVRALQMSGALESALELSVQYAMERNQFGKPISKFQAIQQQLANLAGEVAASTMAGHAVTAAFRDLDAVDIAIGKTRIGEAVSLGTDIAHQVHGAMGYTLEHTLNHRTRRLWNWRDEYGTEREWQVMIGQAFLKGGADTVWQAITERR
ncbi:MAG: acyl-CoA dehydrogenase family protein [Pseudomonadales bacterium]|nr:acyl-CoA dehydrogenase family protein [Pseudomonadales bacterium]MBO6563766.1 acyl-CoA dehydrogenase family protein [Pseudomonadales bacterium]MBO6595575.1 acyl-CoA dehydrogenase family protein [Pseudomonadales bacterium]MBO6820867.1 acyl-CoA dehydrogenase family protein [Pseudomonadales bacterium]